MNFKKFIEYKSYVCHIYKLCFYYKTSNMCEIKWLNPSTHESPSINKPFVLFQKVYPLKLYPKKPLSTESIEEQEDKMSKNKDTCHTWNKNEFQENSELVYYLKNCGKMSHSLDNRKKLIIKYNFKKENNTLRIPRLTNNIMTISPTKFIHNYFKFTNKNQIVECLNKHDIHEATKIQCKAIPIIISGSHLFISSISGSGKTLAYLIPLIDRILNYREKFKNFQSTEYLEKNMLSVVNETKSFHEFAADEMLANFNYVDLTPYRPPFYVILVPTNILAEQIKTTINSIFGELDINAITRQDIYSNYGIENNASFFITTPSSCLNCFKKFKMPSIHSIVMDEADILMKDFSRYIDKFIGLPSVYKMFSDNSIQFIFASASLPDERGIIFLESYFSNIKFVTQNHHIMTPNTEYKFCRLNQERLIERLLYDVQGLLKNGRTILIFVLLLRDVDIVHKYLQDHNITSLMIKSDQNNFSNDFSQIGNKFKVVITSDICSRGIHFSNVDTIINYNFPKHPTTFLHRIGRTARLGGNYFRHPLVLSYLIGKSDVFIANIIIQNYKATNAIYNLPQYHN